MLATGGDSALGGEDWDRRMLERLVDEVFDQHRVDLTAIPMAMSRLREACEAAKKALSVDRETADQAAVPRQRSARRADQLRAHADRAS